MSEENKAIVRRYIEEVWSKGNLAVIDELFAGNFVNHMPAPGLSPDREGFKQFATIYRTGFPNVRATIEDVVAEGDKVVTRWTATGTHQGNFMGIPPTGKQVSMSGMSITQVAGGKIVADWTQGDNLGLMQQLGVVPSPGQ